MNEPERAVGTRSRPRYSVAQKLEIVRFARSNSAQAACRQFNVARSSIYLWTTQEGALLESLRSPRRQHHSGGLFHETADAAAPAVDTSADMTPQERELPTYEARELPRTETAEDAAENRAQTSPDTPPLDATYEPRTPSVHSATPTQAEASDSAARAHEDRACPVLVGYQGAKHGFAYAAAQRTFARVLSAGSSTSPRFELTCFPQASHVLDALRKRVVDIAFIPTDILLSNTCHAALNQMVASRLKIIGEVVVQEDVEVCALPGTELCDIDCVVSDWRTLQRCEEYIVQLELQFGKTIYRQVVWDSAEGCLQVHAEEAENTLVFCTPSAAAAHGLVVLQGRLLGSPVHSRYAVLGREGSVPIMFNVDSSCTLAPTLVCCTLLIKGTARAILDIVGAFAFRGLEIVSFHTRSGDGQQLRSYVISYRASTNPLVERGLHLQLEATSERVVSLGDFTIHMVESTT